ncbi:transmembrane 6 superfamily member 1 [Biomphalaria pfeifferi]|uniref:Transmembrane 6 superfamily member 1 n=1 Tax=Biomphalaria pfeifferi TaxID=112525 RepID=A0AAD8BME4_BIOPF|nr:transmembrane 6 superfamily member 1 [Biomphalaria pfeifferi]
MKEQVAIFIAGITVLTAVTVVPYFLLKRYFKRTDPLVLMLSVFCWSTMIDLGIGLEIDGIISNFMAFYFIEGEPYLYTAYGAQVCYWDGIVHFLLQFSVIVLYCQNRSYRDIALYWIGSILNSMIVLLPGAITGKDPFKLSILLNTPYIILPLLAGFKLLHERPNQTTSINKFNSIRQRPIDLLFFLYFVGAILFSLFRGLVVMGGNAELMKEFTKTYEPYLSDVSNFPKFQMLAYGYFYVVYYLSAAYALLYPGQNWMTDWSIIHAGAAAQGQFSYMAASFHHRTPASLRPPTTGYPALIYWTTNLMFCIVPHLFVWWCKQNEDMNGHKFRGKENKYKIIALPKKIKKI